MGSGLLFIQKTFIDHQILENLQNFTSFRRARINTIEFLVLQK